MKETKNNRRDFARLLDHPTIQAEIGLDQQDIQSLLDMGLQHFDQIRNLQCDYVKNPNKQLYSKRLVELLNQHDQEFTKQLQTTCNIERLIQINVQAYGVRAAAHDIVAQKIGLSPEKAIELRSISERVRRDEMDQLRQKIHQLMRSEDRGQKVRELFRQIDARVSEAIKPKLTTQQLESLNQLKGPPFAIPGDLYERPRHGLELRRRGDDGDREGKREPGRQRDPQDDCAHRKPSACRRIRC